MYKVEKVLDVLYFLVSDFRSKNVWLVLHEMKISVFSHEISLNFENFFCCETFQFELIN